MKVSDYVADYINYEGIKPGFFMIGGAIGRLVDSFYRKKFPLYTMHHEQAAAFAAEGQAAATRKIGLALATSGPGATNLVTGIASAYFASIPVLFITGQPNTFEIGDGKRRQVGFQETDIVSIVKGITKYSFQIKKSQEIAYHLEKAVFLSKSGRMGPVLIDIPFDVQGDEIDPDHLAHFTGSPEHQGFISKLHNNEALIKRAAELINQSKRPVVLVGHGVRLANSEKKLLKFINSANIPAVVSLLGTDAIPASNPRLYGVIGTYGHRHANFAIANADLVIVLGARLDSRQVGVQSRFFAPMAKIVHVDIDEVELGASVKEDVSLHMDVGDFLTQVIPLSQSKPREEWFSFLNWLKTSFSAPDQEVGKGEISPNMFLEKLSSCADEDDIVSADVGSNQMWFAQSWRVKEGQTILTNGGLGPMGYALPSAIGASIACGQKRAWAISGDGGMQINIQELQTVIRNKLPLKIVVLNNHALGMLTQFQTENFEGRLIGSVEGYDAPDFVKIASAYGLEADRLDAEKDVLDKIEWLKTSKGPSLLDVQIPRNYWVFPKASYNKPIFDMRPFVNRVIYRKALKYVDEKYLGV